MPEEVQQYIACNPFDLFTQALEVYKVKDIISSFVVSRKSQSSVCGASEIPIRRTKSGL